MSRHGYQSDYRQGERDFERNGRYGYDLQRYSGYSRDNRDYQEGFDSARREEERRQEEREEERRRERLEEQRAEEWRREQQQYEEEYWAEHYQNGDMGG